MAYADRSEYELEALEGEAHQQAWNIYAAQTEDTFWSQAHWKEPYFQAEYDYEDYAPAYCVGYSGCAQYRGSFDDAERSLCANWVRIKGDSRLTWEEALPAIQAAWRRMERFVQSLAGLQ